MPPVSQVHRGEEKLELILSQVGSVRSRLNGLALQQGLFESLSLLVGSGAILLLAAFLLDPLKFLLVAAVLGVVLVFGLSHALRRALLMRASPEHAAQIADQRTTLKGRLTTVVSLAGCASSKGRLWPYLVEDTLSLRDQFTPARVEPRRVSRSVYGLLVYCLLAALVAAFALINRRVQPIARASENELEVDVNTLDVRPLDPDTRAAVEVTGDPAAMRKLAEKLAQADGGQAEPDSAVGRLMGEARDLAGNLQDLLTGYRSKRSRTRLRITDNGERNAADDLDSSPKRHRKLSSDNGSGQFEREGEQAGNGRLPMIDAPRGQDSERGRDGSGAQAQNDPGSGRQSATENSARENAATSDGDERGGAGSSHGSGSDPQHLFGQADEPPLGSEGFEITIEAKPAEHGPKGATQSYLPPKVRAALNPRQYPDEPIARSTIPDDDRIAVKRVFDR